MILEKKINILENEIEKYMKKHSDRPYYQEYLRTKLFGYKKIAQNFCGENVLELGSDGAATSSFLVRWSKQLTIVDMEDKFNSLITEDKELERAIFVQTRWEEFQPNTLYSDILLTDSLEHVHDPVSLLYKIKEWLHEDGVLHIIVPNALSFHRLIGVEMGLLESPYSFNVNDIASSHLRVYDFETLSKDIQNATLKLKDIDGIQIKTLTDTQLSTMPLEYKTAMDSLSEICKEHCAEIYAQCTK
jgi:2-polyprenyl-3-methyl-5-hydroxy-6-metoxy-1,4-benzoquinol methylase